LNRLTQSLIKFAFYLEKAAAAHSLTHSHPTGHIHYQGFPSEREQKNGRRGVYIWSRARSQGVMKFIHQS
jgi:hypothetical protein